MLMVVVVVLLLLSLTCFENVIWSFDNVGHNDVVSSIFGPETNRPK